MKSQRTKGVEKQILDGAIEITRELERMKGAKKGGDE